MTDWLLGIDFGTSNTAAAHSGATSGAVETLALSHTSNVMSSAVFVDTPDRIAVGDVAINSAERNPASFVPSPKRLIGGPSMIEVNAYSLPAYALVGAVLRSVLARAGAAHAGQPPAHLVLTHPEAWSPTQIQVLRDGAVYAGADPARISTISEPRAAAQHYSRSHAVDPGAKIAVFDFGGGTLDIAVLAATGNGTFDVLAARGDNGLGGKNFDAMIRRWVENQLQSSNPALLAYLRQAPVGVRQNLDDSIRKAKELLSEAPSANITVAGGGFHDTLQITRDEFDEMIDRGLDRAVELTRATLADAGLAPGQLSALYLTGGTSRIPLVHHKLAQLGPIATLDDPKTVVAQGALTAFSATAQYADTQMQSVIPTATDLLPPQATASAEPTRPGRRRAVRAAMGTAAALLLAAVLTVVLTTRNGNSPTDTANPEPSGPGQTPATTITVATTREQVFAGLPAAIADDLERCRSNGTTKNNGLELQCTFKDGSPAIAGVATDPGIFVSIDKNEAAQDVLGLRDGFGSDDKGELVENTNRTAAASITAPQTSGRSHLTYANNTTGVRVSMTSLLGIDGGKTFLTRTGLIN
ncbi:MULTISPECIES: Hsp70 family protein [Williamsia]|uniref:Hsp70 family protein n=1 Tax=Williamsia TaxID=85043 RepID=UPI0003D34D60|nr:MULTISPECIES: Hsp70 family protein [Williamsia]ETD33325.1 molecular chaperone DnaK [Williamsia sp. D3]PVY30234.1 Hsp70 protein [Williamsia marianensis]PZT97920.1 MAG: Hsp70 family protein [Gordonia sp. (in: high G+C Gram-positive bacteria)]